MTRAKCIAGLILVVLLIAGCTHTREVSPTGEVIIGPEDNGKKVIVNVGDILRLGLPSSPSTGYTWEVGEINEEILLQVGKAEFEPESNVLGAPGKQILRFESVGTGQTSLKLSYHRPWEKGVEPTKTFSIHVTVR